MRLFGRAAASLACLSALSLVTPMAVAQQQPDRPAPAAAPAARAADLVPVDTPVYLVETTTNRSAGIEVASNYDYVQLTRDAGRLADKVIFHRKGDGYIIEHTTGHWDGYRYWHSSPSSQVSLVQRSGATVYEAIATRKGFALVRAGANHDFALAYQREGRHWVSEGVNPFTLNQVYAHFRTQE